MGDGDRFVVGKFLDFFVEVVLLRFVGEGGSYMVGLVLGSRVGGREL